MGGGYLHVHGGGQLLSTIRHIVKSVIIHCWFVVSSPAIAGGVLGGFAFVLFIVVLLAAVTVRYCRDSEVGRAPEEGMDKPGKSPPPLARSPSGQSNYLHNPGCLELEDFVISPNVKLLGK